MSDGFITETVSLQILTSPYNPPGPSDLCFVLVGPVCCAALFAARPCLRPCMLRGPVCCAAPADRAAQQTGTVCCAALSAACTLRGPVCCAALFAARPCLLRCSSPDACCPMEKLIKPSLPLQIDWCPQCEYAAQAPAAHSTAPR